MCERPGEAGCIYRVYNVFTGVNPYYRRTLAPSAVLCEVCKATLLLGPVSLTGDKLHSCSLGQKTVNLAASTLDACHHPQMSFGSLPRQRAHSSP